MRVCVCCQLNVDKTLTVQQLRFIVLEKFNLDIATYGANTRLRTGLLQGIARQN
jgi:hypothetical protein